jgi:hypothetical protein
MCALLVGLPDVTVLAVDDQPAEPTREHVEQPVDRPRWGGCGMAAWVKDRRSWSWWTCRASGVRATGVAQAPLVLPGTDLPGGLVDPSRVGSIEPPVAAVGSPDAPTYRGWFALYVGMPGGWTR